MIWTRPLVDEMWALFDEGLPKHIVAQRMGLKLTQVCNKSYRSDRWAARPGMSFGEALRAQRLTSKRYGVTPDQD